MRHSLLLGLSGLGLLLAPSRRRGAVVRSGSRWRRRSTSHTSSNGQSSSFGINDSFQPTIDLIGSYFITWTGRDLDLELRTGMAATGTGYTRQRTSLGPGVTFDDPTFPLYGRVSVPLQMENTFVSFLRAGGGLKILDLAFLRALLRGDRGLPARRQRGGVFSSQAFNAGLGAWLRL